MKAAMVCRTPGELIEIDRRQERLDWMRAEFRDAQQRRYEKAAAPDTSTALAKSAPGSDGRSDMGIEDRGFASMDQAKRREIASMGGTMAHVKGTAHQWTSEEAREAGRRGATTRRDRSKRAAQRSPEVGER